MFKLVCGVNSNLYANKLIKLNQYGNKTTKTVIARLYSQEGRETIWKTARTTKRKTFKETLMQPAGDTAFTIGKGAVAGGAACGLGALCYYGIGLSNQSGIVENSKLWPQFVRDRVRDTYMYFGSSVLLTAASTALIFRSPTMFNLSMKNSWMAICFSMAAVLGTGMAARNIDYTPGFGTKQMAWALHTAVVGAFIAPICLAGGPILVRAAWYTLGIVGGLSTVAVCAPSDKFLTMGGPLAIGLGVVFASSIGSMFLPPATALGAGLMSISLYGGLLLFSGFLLYDTQRIIRIAETHPLYSVKQYDPINASISIYLDTLNIFIRLVAILSGGGNNRR